LDFIMFIAIDYNRPDRFDAIYGIRDADRTVFAAYMNREDRDRNLRGLRTGSLSWSAAVADSYQRHEYSLDGFWTGEWVQVHVPDVDDPTAADASPIADTMTRAAHEAEVAELRATVERLTSQLAAARAPITDVTDERLAPIWERAASVAEDEGFCPEYERLANGLGIPGRERTYRGIVNVSFNVYAYARDTMQDGAAEQMEAFVREAVRNLAGNYGVPGEMTHVDLHSVESEDVNVYE
jgi:hypothetical protein